MKTPSVSFLLSLAVLLCSLFTSGCAFGTRHAKVTYPPATSKTNKVALISAPAGSQGEIVLEPFTDDRADKRVVGHVRNGFGMKTAEVVADNDLAEVLNQAVRSELTRAGYTLLSATDSAATQKVPAIGGSLVNLYCDAYMSYEGKASLHVRILRDGQEIFRKTYQGEGSVGMNWAATSASYGTSLSLAIQDALEALKRDLPAALKGTSNSPAGR